MTQSHPLIALTSCSLVLDGHTILDGVDFELRAGQRWALIGANGSGKTMLLKMLRGDIWPTPTGRERRTYHLDGVSSAPAKSQIAYVGSERQDKYVRYDWNLTVQQVVTTGLFDEDIPLTKPSPRQRERVERVLRRFAIYGLRSRKFLSLSYGQRRLTLVARAFVSEAPVLLLDEVFNGLDVNAKKKLRVALQAPRERHAWVLTSHRPQELPANVTNVAHLAEGKLSIAAGARPRTRPLPSPPPRGAGEGTRKRGGGERGAVDRGGVDREQEWLIKITNADIFRDYRPVIRKLDWTVYRGENWAVLGANGSGKSTLLNMIHGDLHPALGGTIERRGLARGAHIEGWKRRVGWISPELQADHYLAKTIEEIVISGRYASVGLNDPPTKFDQRAARRWLEFFGIERLRDRGPRQVSYGQMRLALFARAMINEPQLLLLDEPCTGLDGDVREQVLDVLQRIAEQGTQLIMAVHDKSDIVPAIGKVLKIGSGGKAVFAER